MILGDSLSAGYGIRVAEGWVARLQERLKAQGYEYRVVNASISGETTRGALARLPRALEVHRPAVVVIELGGNDGLRGFPVEVLRENLAAMISLSEGAGARVLLTEMRLPGNYGADYTEKFRAVYQELAAATGAGLAPFFLEGVALNEELMQADGIHPNGVAQGVLLDNIWPFLEPLLADE